MNPRVLVLAVLAGFFVTAPSSVRSQWNSESRTFEPSVDEYVVQSGDTLWDICERIAGDPFLWPQVWAFNPEITNPHWIYPNDIIRFYPSDIELPLAGELGTNLASRSLDQPVATIGDEDTGIEQLQIDAVNFGHRRRPKLRMVGVLLTPSQLESSGVLVNAIEDKYMLTSGDRVFLRFDAPSRPRPSPGQQMMVFRPVREVKHPITHKRLGWLTETTGLTTVLEDRGEVLFARITQANADIMRGQRIVEAPPDLSLPVPRVPATVTAKGYIVAVGAEVEKFLGDQEFAFIDIGSKDGLQVGNELIVYSNEDPFTRERKEAFAVPVGRMVALRISEGTATCLVTDTSVELKSGMSVATRTGPVSSGRSARAY